MRGRSIFALIAAAFATVIACTPKEEIPAVETRISTATTSLDRKGGSMFVSVQASGDWTLEILFKDGSTPWATLSTTSGSGSKSDIIFTYEANSGEERSCALSLVLRGRTELMLTQAGVSSSGGGSSSSTHNGNSTKAQWLELPETVDGDKLDFFTHDMPLGTKRIRNYSYYWDYDALVAHWVAYPLNKGLYGSGTRSDAWGLDPLLPESDQPVLYKGFRESSTYARGHQIPSAHRLSYQANVQTFYGVNMTPQRHTFNEGVWASLENLVKAWSSSCDTLYCVTGCVVKGSTEVAHDNYGREVKIPVAYWKACLRYSSAGTTGISGYSACGFYFDHNYSGTSTASSAMAISIDELEKKLGIDLYVNLPAKVGRTAAEQIEAQDPRNVSVWK